MLTHCKLKGYVGSGLMSIGVLAGCFMDHCPEIRVDNAIPEYKETPDRDPAPRCFPFEVRSGSLT
jgi:hypothetical protein